MTTQIEPNKPQPLKPVAKTRSFKSTSHVGSAIEHLESGQPIVIRELYSNGLLLLRALNGHLNKKLANKSFQEQREYRAAYRKLSHLILIEVFDHQLAVKKAPKIGWLKKLYPENKHFLLPFPQIQGLNSAWQWFERGISIPVLRNKVHPYYGVYFPTRFEHLEIFENWLKRYNGPKKSAMDIGTGCGVLALQMVKHKFQKVFATDTNPNAIVGLTEFMGTTKLSRKIELDLGSLFGKWTKPTELIVFNPPWLPASVEMGQLDEAIYYQPELLPNFFAAAVSRLLPEGKLVVMFSNLAQISGAAIQHPIEKELEEGGRFKLEKCWKKSVKQASDRTKRDQHWREDEQVELWVLVKDEGLS